MELDVVITAQGGGQLTPAGNTMTRPTSRPAAQRGPRQRPAPLPPTAEQIDARARVYARLLQIFQKHADVIDCVTIWGLNQARTWRPGQAPRLFGDKNQPKPALAAILAAKHDSR